MNSTYGLTLLAQASSAGIGGVETADLLFDPTLSSPLQKAEIYLPCGPLTVGQVRDPLPEVPESLKQYDSRLSKIGVLLAKQCEEQIEELKSRYSPERIGVVLGSSTSGIATAEDAFSYRAEHEKFPDIYQYTQQEIGAVSAFIAEYCGFTGPTFTVSTACSSSPKAVAAGRALLAADLCDVVITGGIDSLCQLTVGGFYSLEIVSRELTNPFSKNRCGLNIGEGGALFLLSKDTDAPALLLGVGESSDAYHVSSPHPEGLGAKAAIQQALDDAGMHAAQVGYFNLHGTGTAINDSMEALAVSSVVGRDVPCSSTKPITGHTLGAAGAIELAFCLMALEHQKLPLHRFDGEYDPEIEPVQLVEQAGSFDSTKVVLSNSFAFGGSNCCLAVGAS